MGDFADDQCSTSPPKGARGELSPESVAPGFDSSRPIGLNPELGIRGSAANRKLIEGAVQIASFWEESSGPGLDDQGASNPCRSARPSSPIAGCTGRSAQSPPGCRRRARSRQRAGLSPVQRRNAWWKAEDSE